MSVQQSYCSMIFVDIYESLYCSIIDRHQVEKTWANGTSTIIAGRGVRGSSLNMLDNPQGIFVDINLDLYVADSNNHRIQLFRLNQFNGITVAGDSLPNATIELSFPSGIILDGEQHLFIVDRGNHRIIGSNNEHGFHCIFGCSGQGSTNDKLYHPTSMAFDSHGNIYVIDQDNHRIQKIMKNNIYDGESSFSSRFRLNLIVFNIFLYCLDIRQPVETKYSSNLTIYSHKCNYDSNCRFLNYYCEIIEIYTTEEGYYTITSNTNIKQFFGYAVEKNFTVFDVRINAIQKDITVSSYNDNQFKIALHREINTSFVLIVTTSIPNNHNQGAFSITIIGPSNAFMQRISMTENVRRAKQFLYLILDDTKLTIQTNYSSNLSDTNQQLSHHNCREYKYYYEGLKINVNTSGYYMFSSDSNFNIYGYLYEYQFDPYNAIDTSLAQNDDSCEDFEFQIIAYLHFNITYVLIVTSSHKHMNTQGSFSVIVKGPDRSHMKRIGMYIHIV